MGNRRSANSEKKKDSTHEKFEEWQSLIHQISGVLYECAFDQHWTMYWISEGIENLTGYPSSDIIGNNIRSYNSIIHPDDRAIVRKVIEEAVSKDEYFSIEYRIIDSSGEIKWVEERGKPEYDDKGNLTFLRGIIVDATVAKETEKIARKSRQKYRALFESSMDGIAFTDLEGRFEEVNPAFVEMTGYTEKELKELTYKDITPPSHLKRELEVYHPQLIGRGYSDLYEKEYIRKDGSRVPVRIRTWLLRDPGDKPYLIAAVVQDVSQEKSTIKALKHSQEQLRLLFNEAPIGIEILDDEGRIIRANPAGLDIYGVEEEQQVIGFSVLEDPNTPEFAKESIRNHESCRYESKFDYSLVRKHDLYHTNKTGAAYLETTIAPLGTQEDSLFRGFMIQVEDVTEQKQASEALKESEERFYALFRDSPIGIEILDENGRIVAANSAALQIFGISDEEEIIGLNLLEDPNTPKYAKEKIRNREPCKFDSKFDYSRVKEQELYTTSKNGIAYLETLITPLGKGKDSDFRGFMIQLQDVTERKNMLNALQDSEEQYRTTLEALDDPMYVVDRDLRIYLTNPAMTKWLNRLGLDDNVVGKRVMDAFPFLSEEIVEKYHQVFKNNIVFRTRDEIHIGKSIVHIETTRVPIMSRGRTVQVLTQIRDITSQRRNQKKLERSEKRYRTLIESIDLGFLFHDSKGRIISINPAAESILGISEKDAKNHRFEQLSIELRNENGTEISPENLPLTTSLRTGKQSEFSILQIFNKEKGERRWVNMKAVPLKYAEHESPLEAYSIIDDITEEYRAQQALQKEHDRAQNYLDIAGAIILVIDSDGFVQEINEKGCTVLGYSQEEVVGKNWIRNFIPQRLQSEIRSTLDSLSQGDMAEFSEFENPIINRDGEERVIEWRNSPLTDDEGSIVAVLSSGVDITKRKEMEENLRTTAETANLYLDLMGHDIRNYLQSIIMAVDIISERSEDHEITSFLDIIIDATKNATHLIQKVGNTKGFLSAPLRKLSLTNVIRVALSEFKQKYPYMDIELVEKTDDPLIYADKYLFNLIANLLENSAIHNDNDQPFVQIEVERCGEGYEISIIDNGPGIPHSEKEAIFDPNRRYGGVGIPQALKIADKYGAEISVHDRVKNCPELGADFRIWLPKAPT